MTDTRFHYCTYADTPRDTRVTEEGERLRDMYPPESIAHQLGIDIILTVQRYQKARRLLDYLVVLTAEGRLQDHPERQHALEFLDAHDLEFAQPEAISEGPG